VARLLPGRELHPLEAPGFAWRTKVARYVAFNDPLVRSSTVSDESFANVCHGVIGTSIWPESVGIDAKVSFPLLIVTISGFLPTFGDV
jgi:hypothetical protein